MSPGKVAWVGDVLGAGEDRGRLEEMNSGGDWMMAVLGTGLQFLHLSLGVGGRVLFWELWDNRRFRRYKGARGFGLIRVRARKEDS